MSVFVQNLLTTTGNRRVLALIAATALGFFALCFLYSIDRGLHVDEVATITEGRQRLANSSYQAQHGLFLDFFRGYNETISSAKGPLRLALLRLPSIVGASLGLFLMGALALRVFARPSHHPWPDGSNHPVNLATSREPSTPRRPAPAAPAGEKSGLAAATALFAVLLPLGFPLFWRSAMEIRFYGILFLLSILALWAIYWAVRGRLLVSLATLVSLGWIAFRCHPAAGAFHGTTLVVWAGIAVVHGMLILRRLVRENALPAEQCMPLSVNDWVRLLLAVGVLLAGLIGLVVILAQWSTLLGRIPRWDGNLESEKLPDGWGVLQMIEHAFQWTGQEASRAISRALHYLLAGCFLAGLVALLVRGRWCIALLGVALWLPPHVAAFFVGWNALFSVKYLTSTLPVLLLLASAGLGSAVMALRRPGMAPWLAPAVGALALSPFWLAGLSSGYRLIGSDPSNAHKMVAIMERHSGDETPVLLTSGVLRAGLYEARNLGLAGPVHVYNREELTTDVEGALMLRNQPFFRADFPSRFADTMGGLPFDAPGMRVYADFRSTFNSQLNSRLVRFHAEPVLAGGMEGELIAGNPFALMERGSWLVETDQEAKVTIGEAVYTQGEVLTVEAPTSLNWRVDPPGTPVSLRPHWAPGELRRSGHLANTGTISRFDRALGQGWRLSSNVNVGYSLSLPDYPALIHIEAAGDDPQGHALLVRFRGAEVGELHVNHATQPGQQIVYTIRIPEELRGRNSGLEITHLSENSVNKAKSEDVRTLDIRALRIERAPAMGLPPPPPPSFLARVQLTEIPTWPPNEETMRHLTVMGGGRNPIRVEKRGDKLALLIPPDCDTQGVMLPLFSLSTGTGVMQVRLRTENLVVTTFAAFCIFMDNQGQSLGQVQLSQQTVGRLHTEPTWRSGFVQPPAGAAYGGLYLFVNLPQLQELERDGRLFIENFRYWQAVHGGPLN